MSYHFRDVFRLEEQFWLVGAAFLIEKSFHARRGRAAGIDTQDADAVGVDFIAQTVGDGAKRVLRCGKLSGADGGTKASGRIDKHDLARGLAQERQHGLDQGVVAANVGAVHQIKVGQGSLLVRAVSDGAAAKQQNV